MAAISAAPLPAATAAGDPAAESVPHKTAASVLTGGRARGSRGARWPGSGLKRTWLPQTWLSETEEVLAPRCWAVRH